MSSPLRYTNTMPPKPKILYIITKSNWGGAQRYVYDLAVCLKNEWETKVAAGARGRLFEELKKAGIPAIGVASFQRDINLLKEIFALAELVSIFLREKPDIVHLNSSKAGGIGAVAAKIASLLLLKRIRVIFTVHGWGFFEPRPRWQNAVIRIASAISAWLQDKIILISKSDFHAANFISAKKLVFIPLGITMPEIYTREKSRRTFSRHMPQPVEGGELIIGTIAELTKNKGLEYLIEAGKILRDKIPDRQFHILIIGEGEKRKEIEEKIKDAGMQNTVRLLGFLPDAVKLLPCFDIFVLPSLKEGLPYTIIEAASAGLPVVATAIGGIPDLIDDQKNGILVAPGDARGLANALKTLILNADLRQKMGSAGAKKIAKHFSLQSMIQKTTNVYHQCLNNTKE